MLDYSQGLSVTVDSLMVLLVNRMIVTQIVQLGMRYAEELHPTLFTKQTTSVREHLKLIILVFFQQFRI